MYPNPLGVMLVPNMTLPGHPAQMTVISQSLPLPFSFGATTAQMASMYSHLPSLPPPQDALPPWLRTTMNHGDSAFNLTDHIAAFPQATVLERPTAIRPPVAPATSSFAAASQEQLWPMMQLLSASDNLFTPTSGSLFATTIDGSLILNQHSALNPLFSTTTSGGPSIYGVDASIPPVQYGSAKEMTTRPQIPAGKVVMLKEATPQWRTVPIPAPDDPEDPPVLSTFSRRANSSSCQTGSTSANFPRSKTTKLSKAEEEKRLRKPADEVHLVVFEANGLVANACDRLESTAIEMKAPLKPILGCPIKHNPSWRRLDALDLKEALSKDDKRVTEVRNGSQSGRKINCGRGSTFAKRMAEAMRREKRKHQKLMVKHQQLHNLDATILETANGEIFEGNLRLIMDTTQVLRSVVCQVAEAVDFPEGLETGHKKPKNPHKKNSQTATRSSARIGAMKKKK